MEAIDLAAGEGGDIEQAVGAEADNLDAEVGGLKEREGLAVFADAEDGGWRRCADVGCALWIRGDGPDKGGWGGEGISEARALKQVAVAGDGDTFGCAFFEVFYARLGPELGALGLERRGDGSGCERCREEEKSGWVRVGAWVAEGNKHAAVESTKDGCNAAYQGKMWGLRIVEAGCLGFVLCGRPGQNNGLVEAAFRGREPLNIVKAGVA